MTAEFVPSSHFKLNFSADDEQEHAGEKHQFQCVWGWALSFVELCLASMSADFIHLRSCFARSSPRDNVKRIWTVINNRVMVRWRQSGQHKLKSAVYMRFQLTSS